MAPRQRRRLTDAKIAALPQPAGIKKDFVDGSPGLYLLRRGKARTWRWRFTDAAGKDRHVTLDPWPKLQYDGAVARAAELRQLVKNGGDPFARAAELRGVAPRYRKAAPASGDSLEALTAKWMDGRRRKDGQPLAPATVTRDERIARHLLAELGGATHIEAVTRAQVRDAVLRLAAAHGAETAQRALAITKDVFNYAVAFDHVPGSPVAGLEARALQIAKTERHLAAIEEPKAFGALLRAINSHSGYPLIRVALKLLALTFVRPSELRLARWVEIEIDGKAPQWIVPAARTKLRRDLIVPLATQAVALLEYAAQFRDPEAGDYVLPGARRGRPLSENTLNMALRSLGYTGDMHVAHGFRSSASTMLKERLMQNGRVVEHQLAHAVGSSTQRVYDRAEFLDERRAMMRVWADYLDQLAADEGANALN